jgi:putative oxidoreductase
MTDTVLLPHKRMAAVATASAEAPDWSTRWSYSAVAVVLRLVLAHVFFAAGQSKVVGLELPLKLPMFEWSVTLPLGVTPQTLDLFAAKFVMLPILGAPTAYLVSFAEFILPLCLILGLATRFAAFGLLMLTVLLQIFVQPDALWTMHIYWASMLLVLMAMGAGNLSIDRVIRFIREKM